MRVRTAAAFLFIALMVVGVIPLLPVCVIFGWRDVMISYGRWIMRVSGAIVGIKVDVSGRENACPPGPCVYMCNHASFLDGPMMAVVIPRHTRIIMKKSIFRLPVAGPAMRFTGFVPVDRKRARGGVRSIEEAVDGIRTKGYSFLIFPEGTRSRDGRLQAFKRGGFFLALAAGVPIVPVTITGSFGLMPKGSRAVRKGKVGVEFHPAMATAGYSHESMPELMALVRRSIQEGTGGGPDA